MKLMRKEEIKLMMGRKIIMIKMIVMKKKNIDENLDNPDKIEVKNNNNNEENDENNGVKTAKELLKA